MAVRAFLRVVQSGSDQGAAAVHNDELTLDVAGGVAGQVEHGAVQLTLFAGAAGGVEGVVAVEELLGLEEGARGHLGFEEGGADGVDGDVVLGVGAGHALGQAQHRRLGGVVGVADEEVALVGDDGVAFTPLTEDAIPQQISSEVIPEYRDMERALACVADEKVYVVAMRGEKPTTGYDIAIDSMAVTSDEDGEKTLTVNVLFTDPQAGASLTQAQTYPYVVAETDLKDLPDKIEMKIKYTD